LTHRLRMSIKAGALAMCILWIDCKIKSPTERKRKSRACVGFVMLFHTIMLSRDFYAFNCKKVTTVAKMSQMVTN
jgi:hypothetical protein